MYMAHPLFIHLALNLPPLLRVASAKSLEFGVGDRQASHPRDNPEQCGQSLTTLTSYAARIARIIHFHVRCQGTINGTMRFRWQLRITPLYTH
jgi:hypothetical protein